MAEDRVPVPDEEPTTVAPSADDTEEDDEDESEVDPEASEG